MKKQISANPFSAKDLSFIESVAVRTGHKHVHAEYQPELVPDAVTVTFDNRVGVDDMLIEILIDSFGECTDTEPDPKRPETYQMVIIRGAGIEWRNAHQPLVVYRPITGVCYYDSVYADHPALQGLVDVERPDEGGYTGYSKVWLDTFNAVVYIDRVNAEFGSMGSTILDELEQQLIDGVRYYAIIDGFIEVKNNTDS